MKNELIFVLMLFMMLLQASGIPLQEGAPGHPVQAAEDDITDEDADAAAASAPALAPAASPVPSASPVPAAAAAPQRDDDGSLSGEPDTDF